MRKWLVFLLILGLCLFVIGCDDDDDDPVPNVNVKIGGLIPHTGNLSQYADQLETFIHFAEEDVNSRLASSGSEIRIGLVCHDTETEGDIATIAAELLHRVSAVNCFVGPLTSGELLAMTESSVIDSILVLSPGSTAPSLSIPNDNIFRFVTSDSQMATVLSEKMYNDGIRQVATLYRMDTWGEALSGLIDEAFTELGGEVITNLEFYGSRRSEVVETLDTLYAAVTASNLPSDQIALQLTSLQEGAELFRVINDSIDVYPLLADIRWYGSDGLVQTPSLVTEEGVRELAAQVQYTAPIFGLAESAEMTALKNRFAEVSDQEPWTYSFIAYDIVTVIGEAMLNVSNPNDLQEVRTEIIAATENITGVTGSLELNNNGDRLQGNYDFWQVVENGGVYSWELVTP